MFRVRHYVGPPWPPTLETYDYMRFLTLRDWAWEGLRRNPAYQDEARAQLTNSHMSTRLEGGAILTRMHERSSRAEAWALCSFRGSIPIGARSASNMDATSAKDTPLGHCRARGRQS